MKESILRAAAIAALVISLIVAVSTWFGVATAGIRGGTLLGFFYGLLALFLGFVAWALLSALADIPVVRMRVEQLQLRVAHLEDRLENGPEPGPEPGPANGPENGLEDLPAAGEEAGTADEAGRSGVAGPAEPNQAAAAPDPATPNPGAPNPATPNPAAPNPAAPNPAAPNPRAPDPATPDPAAPSGGPRASRERQERS